MTNEIESSEPRRLALRGLPWLLGAGAVGLYLLTLNPWVSILNLSSVARVSGWTWHPEVVNPAYYLVTLPLKLLPTASVPLALNGLSAVLAALVLVQLARCVALLPHDRTQAQREREYSDGAVFSGTLSWVPPVLAVCLCGLQLTFWEHATNGTAEMLDLLLFAFVVRAVLEYRYHGREYWLSRAALVMGAGLSCNVAMIAFFPMFLAALVWVRGVSFFNSRFLVRTLLMGLLGLLLYFLLPLVATFKTPELAGFWDALTANISLQKSQLLMFPRKTLVLLSLTSLLPIIVIAIRWASYFGDTSQVGQLFASIVFHAVHAFFLGAAFWVALDPPFGPRNAGYGLAFLPFYFMGALGAGYFSGYFLLVFGPVLEKRMRRPPTPITDFLHKCSTVAVLLLLAATPIALVMRNLDEIRTTNGPLLRDYADSLLAGLPPKAVLVSDDIARLFLAQSVVAAAKSAQDYVIVQSEWLSWDTYHQRLHQRHGNAWPGPEKVQGKAVYTPPLLISLVSQLCATNRVFYLHPSFGYYFEAFHADPNGLSYELKPFAQGELLPPPLSEDLIARNEAFFRQQTDTLLGRVLAVTRTKTGTGDYVGGGPLRKIRLRRHRNATALLIGAQYSRAVNCWGVEMQKAGKLEEAARYFELATQLNPENVVAERNLEFNRKLRAGVKPVVQIPDSVEDLFGAGRSWDQVLSANGPYDDPSLCLLQGYLFTQTGLYRQAAQCFDRVRQFSDTDFPSRLWLAQFQIMANQPDAALALTREIRSHPERFPLDETNRVDLLTVESAARFAKPDVPGAVELIEKTIAANPHDSRLLVTAVSIYNQHGQFSNSLAVVEKQLAANPENLTALLNQGYICIQLGRYEQGIAALNKLLSVETNNASALLNRAIAFLQNNQLTQAKADYENLVRQYPTTHQLYYGLAEIALRQGDTNTAIRHTETYLTNAPPNTPEYQAMSERLRALMGEKPK